jgi:hypothetical protein
MGFAQLYYTSCESGLSDFAGFQFNAATPGLAPQVLREVEALTSYEPPRSLGYRPSPAEIAACPVNLVYRPEPTTMLANVVFVGLDFSQRLGNYFAHALVAETGADRFEEILPIELWGSSVWAGEPIADRELPALPELPSPTGQGLSRAGIDRFLSEQASHDHDPDQLAALVTAAEDAVLRRGRSIVIIESTSTAAAHWIAAISFLLPPAVARRMSFATYRHRPEYSDAHLVATLPESDFVLDDSAFHSYVVFDPASGRNSPVPPDPAAMLLVDAGAEGAARLWKRAAELTDGTVNTLAEGYPLLVIAAILEHQQVSPTDLDALAGWLAVHPGGLRPAALQALLPQLRAGGERVLGPALVSAGGGQVLTTLASSRALLEGALAHLSVVAAADPDAVVEIFAGGLGDLIEDDVPLSEPLRRAALLARCRADLLGDRPAALPPTGTDWLVQAILEPSRARPYLPAYLDLCRAIEDGTIGDGAVTGPVQGAVSAFLETARELDQARAEPDQAKAFSLRRLADCYPEQRPPGQDLLRAGLAELIEALAGSAHLQGALAGCPDAVLTAYLEAARWRLAQRPTDVAGAALIFEVLQTLRPEPDAVLAPALAEVLRHGLRSWPSGDLDQLQDHLRQQDSRLATSFTQWRGQHLGRMLGRSLRRLTQRRAGTDA